MRTPLIAACGLVGLISLADTASSTDPEAVGNHSRTSLRHTCDKLGGELHDEENFSSRCTLPGDGATIECDDAGYCQGWVPCNPDKGKVGTGTTAGTPEAVTPRPRRRAPPRWVATAGPTAACSE